MAVKGKVLVAKPGQHAITKAVPTKEELSSDDDHIDEDMDSEEIESEDERMGMVELDDSSVDTDDDEDFSEEEEVMADEPAKKSPANKALAASKPTPGEAPASVGRKAPGKAETPKTPAKIFALGERDKRSVFVKHLRHQTTEAQIAAFFQSAGKVIKTRIVRCKSFAIVLFDNPEAVEKALTLNGSAVESLNGNNVVIERCLPTLEKLKRKNRKQKMRLKEKEKTSQKTPSPSNKKTKQGGPGKTKPNSGGKQQPKGQRKKKVGSVEQQGAPTVKTPLKKETKPVTKGSGSRQTQGTKGQQIKKVGSVKQQGAPTVKTPLKKETKLVKKGNAAQGTKGQPKATLAAKNKKSPDGKKGKKQRNTK